MIDTASEKIISLKSVTKRYGKLNILQDLSLDVSRNEHVSLIGPSGSGKSTILRVLMTLEPIQSGAVTIDGDYLWRAVGDKSIAPPEPELRQIRQKVGMVFQSFNLFPHMTAIRNVAEAPMRVLKMSKAEAYEKAKDLLKLVGLSGRADHFPIQLSGGQQQRVAIARTLAMHPKVLLFDEVTSALDPETVGEVLNVIRHLAKEFKFTILYVTHQMGFAREISHRICFLEGGRIVEQGAPDKILDHPQEPRTKAFLKAVLES